MKVPLKSIIFSFLFISSAALADVVTCDRSRCEGGQALVYSTKDDPAIVCDDRALCSYVRYYLDTKRSIETGDEDADNPEILRDMQQHMVKARVANFEEATKQYRIAAHRQKVNVEVMNFEEDLAHVKPTDGGESYWISFENLTPVARKPKAYSFDGDVTKGSAVIASLVNAGTGIYGVKSISRQDNALLPQSFDERISFFLEGYGSTGGQIFICSSRKFCDSIYGYFTLFTSLAGPYLFRSKDGKIVAQLNSSLAPETALSFESALLRLR